MAPTLKKNWEKLMSLALFIGSWSASMEEPKLSAMLVPAPIKKIAEANSHTVWDTAPMTQPRNSMKQPAKRMGFLPFLSAMLPKTSGAMIMLMY